MEAIAHYDPGADITCQHTAGATGGKFVTYPAARNTGGPSGISDTGDGNLIVTTPAANVEVFGVTSHDVAAGQKVNVMRAPKVVAVIAGGAVPIGAYVSTDNQGRAVVATAATGVVVGRALTLGALDAFMMVDLVSGRSLAP
jgi:Uncharacterized conserved protein (DUF2190)